MPKFSLKLAYVAAVICLALMVVALGTVAKHSQFKDPADSTHYLKQSVKMVSSDDFAITSEAPGPLQTIALHLNRSKIPPPPAITAALMPVRSPLLI